MPSDSGIKPSLVDELLALETRGRQSKFLKKAGLLDAGGLGQLLDLADRFLGEDPGKAQQLAELCSDLAEDADARAAVPRASYIRAGVYNLNGDFDMDLRLVTAARDGYAALGLTFDALRTNVGRMDALLQLGRYAEAADAGWAVLKALGSEVDSGARATRREHDLLAALVHQNLGGCFYQTGRYGEALEAYVLAEGLYRSLGMTKSRGEVIDNQGIVFRHLGRSSEALTAHKVAAGIFREANLTLSHALALSNAGETYLQLCDYMRSLESFEHARRLLNALDASVDKHIVSLDTANAYLALNLYPEALAAYAEAVEPLKDAGVTFEHARGLWGMGSALIASSRFAEAEEALKEAAGLFAAVGNTPFLADVMVEQASLLAARGHRAEGVAQARRALDTLAAGAWPVQEVYARLRLADLLWPKTDEVEHHLGVARRLVESLALPHLHYRLNERLGHLRLRQGRNEEARVLLESAVREIDRLRGPVAHDAMRASFLRDKTVAYEDLLLLHLTGREGVHDAFAAAEQAKSRALVDLLTGIVRREPTGSDHPGLEERARTLQADLNAVYSELLGSQSDDQSSETLPSLRARAGELEQEIGRLRLRSVAAGHDPDPLTSSVASRGVRDGLPADTVLLAYHTVGDEILGFVSACGRVRVARRISTVTRTKQALRLLGVQWQRFGGNRRFAGRHARALERSARQVLATLYGELVAPLEPLLEDAVSGSSGWPSVPKLAVVPHGLLHRVPFHALFDGGRYLIERFEISYAPSATAYALCQDREPLGENGAAVFGVEDPLIPAATVEAYAVAEHLPGARIRVGDDATVEALRDEASKNDILHLACHGLFRSDNPMFSSLKLQDGWLTAADAMSLDLPGALVTLSACESGRGLVIGGDEVLGLTRAFLGAGAATLVVSLWLVQDEATAELMGDCYGRMLNGEGRAAALRGAQLKVKERYPHPYHWGPFVLIGKR